MNQAKLSPYTTNPRRKGGRYKNHNQNSKQLPSLNLTNNKLAMMMHSNSDPVETQHQNHFKSAITTSFPKSNPSINSSEGEASGKLDPQFYSGNYVHPPPLENRNSAPEIVVLSPGRELPKIPIGQQEIPVNSTKKNFSTYGVEDRIHRAKAKVFQNGGLFRSAGSKESTYYMEDDFRTQLAPNLYQPAPASIPQGPCSSGSGHVRQKLSTRFHSAQKLNYKLAALSSFASAASANINVRRSRTFNISDIHEQLSPGGNGGCNGNIIYDNNEPISNTNYYTKTLPKQMKTSSSTSPRKTQTMKKLESNTLSVVSGARDSNSSSSSGVFCGSYSSDITTTGSSNGTGSVGDIGSGASSTASSRKSSNSSSKDETTIEEDGTGNEIRTNISEDALKEIAAFESFIAGYAVQQIKQPIRHQHCCASSSSQKTSGGAGKMCCMAFGGGGHMVTNAKCHNTKSQLTIPSSNTIRPPSGPRGRRMIASGGVVRTLERQKKITSMSSQNSEEA